MLDPDFLAGWYYSFKWAQKNVPTYPTTSWSFVEKNVPTYPKKTFRLLRLSIRPIFKDLIIMLLYNCFGVNLEAWKCIPPRDRSHQNARLWLVLTTETDLIYFIAKGTSTIHRNHCAALDLCKSIELAGFYFAFRINMFTLLVYEHSEQARAPHTNGPRDVPRCGALSLLKKTPHYRGGRRNRC